MTRGRRPDAGLEPSRQLLTQRAFRQRRAAHLAELEGKVARLERENAKLRGIEFVEDEEEGDEGRKRIKSEVRDSFTSQGADIETHEIDDSEAEQESYCEMCALHEKERQDLLKTVAFVDSCLMTLSESMQTLQQKLHRQPEQSSQGHTAYDLNLPARKMASQQNNLRHQHSYSGSSSSDGTSSALASTSSSSMLSAPLPTSSTSDTSHKRRRPDEQRSPPSQTITSPFGSQVQKSRKSSAVAAAAASARSAGSANATCTPSSGDCCSKQSHPTSNARSLSSSQQQSQTHNHPSSQPNPPHNISRQRNILAPPKSGTPIDLGQFDMDDSKCCLGLFECDSNGNFVAT